MFRGVLFFFLLVLAFSKLESQSINGRYAVGLHTGGTVFFGDVKMNEWFPSVGEFNEIRFGGGLQFTYVVNPYLSLRYHWLNAGLAGYNLTNDEKFSAIMNDHGVQAMINMTSIFFYDEDRAQIEIWGMLGYGLNGFRTVRRRISDDSFLFAFGYTDRGQTRIRVTRELSIPVGLSLRTRLDRFVPMYRNDGYDRIEIALDAILFLTNTDKLDAKETGGKDRYTYFSVGVNYYFGDLR